jgi:RNA polymerase sigma-70 factor (ECF subfamily)
MIERAGASARELKLGEIDVQEGRLSAGSLQKLEGRILFFSPGSVKFDFPTADRMAGGAFSSPIPARYRGNRQTRSNNPGPTGVYRVGECMLEAQTIDLRTPDELLVRRARSGEPAACSELFQRHRNGAYRLAYRHLGNEQDALDVVQESMIKAFSALGDFDGRSGFRTWLMKIVTHTAMDWGRRRQRRLTVSIGNGFTTDDPEGGIEPRHEDDPARGVHQEDMRQILDQALDRLSPTLRATFVLYAESGMSYKEIAEAQGIPLGTVMSRIHAAREKLQADPELDRLL